MGMWETDCRHGPGLLVTLDGIYNQGTFAQNKLMVCTLKSVGMQLNLRLCVKLQYTIFINGCLAIFCLFKGAVTLFFFAILPCIIFYEF